MEQSKNSKKEEPAKTDSPVFPDFQFSDSCFSKSICSSNDCTGLIPALPSSQEELDAYEEMYQFCMGQAKTGRQDSD